MLQAPLALDKVAATHAILCSVFRRSSSFSRRYRDHNARERQGAEAISFVNQSFIVEEGDAVQFARIHRFRSVLVNKASRRATLLLGADQATSFAVSFMPLQPLTCSRNQSYYTSHIDLGGQPLTTVTQRSRRCTNADLNHDLKLKPRQSLPKALPGRQQRAECDEQGRRRHVSWKARGRHAAYAIPPPCVRARARRQLEQVVCA